MAIPSRLTGSGVASQAATNICGDTATSLTATGTTYADALRLSSVINHVSTTASGTGVLLPPIEPGASVFVINSGANALLVYPGTTGAQINALTATTQGFSVDAGGRAQFIAFTATKWGAILSA